ncbi:hypothetical protein [Pedobacter sp. NJ-S-72]
MVKKTGIGVMAMDFAQPDPTGKIIASNLRGEDLAEKIAKLIK